MTDNKIQRVFVRSDTAAIKALRVSVPDDLIRFIIGHEFDMNEWGELLTTMAGQPMVIAVPLEAVKILDE